MATGIDLKNEDEVQEYLERLGIEYRFGCYYEKDGKGNIQNITLLFPLVGVIHMISEKGNELNSKDNLPHLLALFFQQSSNFQLFGMSGRIYSRHRQFGKS